MQTLITPTNGSPRRAWTWHRTARRSTASSPTGAGADQGTARILFACLDSVVHDELPAAPPAPAAPVGPAIPAQRAPQWPEAVPVYLPAPQLYLPAPQPFDPALLTALAAERSKSKRALFIAGALFLVLALVG